MEKAKRLRPRHDGWTPERQLRFCAELARTGCVTDACRAVGMSTTSAYRTYDRVPAFAAKWDAALQTERPILEQAAFDRAVYGVEVGIHRNGQVVATHRRYSDGLLRFLLERDDRRTDRAPKRRQQPEASADEVRAEILRKVKAVKDARAEGERREALAHAERMRREGRAP